VLKTANPAGPVNAGSPIGFDITVSNIGTGLAIAVTLSDPLPGNGGLNWSLSPAFTGCAVTGAVGTQTLNCTLGDIVAGASVGPIHLTSPTTSASCATIPNTATVAATNEAAANQGNNTSTASVVVNCPTFQGCTPGFWQGGNGIKLWNTSPDPQWTAAKTPTGSANPPFIQTTLFNSFFTPHASLAGKTMLDIVGTGGGPNPAQKAARSLIAAYLNSSIGLNYPYTPAQLTALWNAANDGDDSDGELLALHNLLDAANNLHSNTICD
jgi:uncharacterized repeat protein (TIGR01451 family)